jgi:mono/diheme cytochrome c family protein
MKHAILIMVIAMSLAACSSGTKDNKKEASAPETTQKTSEVKEDISSHPGAALYNTHCLPCHQADGNGVPGMYPSIRKSDWVNGDTDKLIGIVLFGMTGEIQVHGEMFNSVMAPLPHLSDEEVANILTFIRKTYENEGPEVTPGQVKQVREAGAPA